MPGVFAAWNRNDAIPPTPPRAACSQRWRSIFWKSGGVVFGAAFDGKQHLRHIACFRKEELWRLRGQVRPERSGGTFRCTLKRCGAGDQRPGALLRHPLPGGRSVPVPGRPAGESHHLRSGVSRGPVSRRVGGYGPAPFEARKHKGLQAVRFRNKVTGWKDSHFTAVYGDGTVDPRRCSHGIRPGLRPGALFLRPSCYRCPYTSMTRVGDLTLGDFWGLRPDELPEQQEKGISLLLVNTLTAAIFRPAAPGQAGGPRRNGPSPEIPGWQRPLPCRRSGRHSLPPTPWSPSTRCAGGVLPPAAAASAGAGRLLSPEVKAAIRKKLK